MRHPRLILALGCGLLLQGATASSALNHDPLDARAQLVRGVRAIESGGSPGVVLCVGSNAFPLVGATCGSAVQPVAAAAFYGQGRVVAVGHGSFLSPDSFAKADTAAFAKNAVAWLGQGRAEIAVYKNSDMLKALGSLSDVTVREIPSLDVLDTFAVLATYPDGLKPEEIETVRAFVTRGGGLLCAGIGWGWQQVTRGKSLATENLFNRLLGPAGLLINSDMAGRTANDGYRVDASLPAGVNAAEAVRLAASGQARDPELLRQINHSLCAAKAVLPPQETDLSRALDALMRTPEAAKLPSRETPLKAADIPARLALIQHKAAWQAKPLEPWPAHPAAAAYPGTPAKDAPRGSRALTVSLDIPRWHGTGLFAAAGEPVTVELPPGAEALGLRLRIGSTTCDNTRHDTWTRAPKVDLEIPLKARTVTASSPFGGLVYIVVPDAVEAESRQIKVTLRNACRALWFKAGRDSQEAWKRMLQAPSAPWAELESDKIVLTVPLEAARSVEDPAALLAFWEKAADLDARLTAIPPQRRSAERFCADAQLCAGWMHAGYPIMIPASTAQELVNLAALKTKGDWGFFHELGHNHQNGDWTFSGTGEVTVNFFTLYAMEHLCGLPPRKTRMGEAGIQRTVNDWVAKGKSHDDWCRDPFLALETFVRLQQVFGWASFEKLFAEYRALDQAARPRDDAAKRDQWATRLSRITGHNIAAVFDAWNIPLSDAARRACAQYPKPADPRLFEGVL